MDSNSGSQPDSERQVYTLPNGAFVTAVLNQLMDSDGNPCELDRAEFERRLQPVIEKYRADLIYFGWRQDRIPTETAAIVRGILRARFGGSGVILHSWQRTVQGLKVRVYQFDQDAVGQYTSPDGGSDIDSNDPLESEKYVYILPSSEERWLTWDEAAGEGFCPMCGAFVAGIEAEIPAMLRVGVCSECISDVEGDSGIEFDGDSGIEFEGY